MTAPANKIYLSDYTPPAYLIDTVGLTFKLAPKTTRVISRIAFRPNPDSKSSDFFLHGEHLKLISAKIDGADVSPNITAAGLTCDVPNAPFIWECEVEIAPEDNTALEGLYMSNAMYCTQCEAEGFRRITYYPDRPDVMAHSRCALKARCPCCCQTATKQAAAMAGPCGMTLGPNRPIYLRWWRVIWLIIPIISPHHPGVRSS